MDVGETQVVEAVNSRFQIFSKSGSSVYGPATINTLWSGFGGLCQSDNDGDGGDLEIDCHAGQKARQEFGQEVAE